MCASAAGAACATIAAAVVWHATEDLALQLSEVPHSSRFLDVHRAEVLVRPAADGQIRRPYCAADGNRWIEAATCAVEDVRFEAHRGVDLRAIVRAVAVNVRSRRAAEGASTIAMQVAKLVEPRPRTWSVKVSEALRALKLVDRIGRERTLEAYLTLAPYGGNRVGAESAAIAYFGRPLRDLSLAECALIAGLPQSPERFRPDRHPEAAVSRRNLVLDRMLTAGMIDAVTHAGARAEELTLSLPARALIHPSALMYAEAQRPGGGRLTIDPHLQRIAEEEARRQAAQLGGDVQAAVAILEIESGAWRALAVSTDPDDPAHGWLPLFAAWRSPGSALKPLIYAAAFEVRRLDPHARVPDIERDRAGWRPRNFAGGEAGWTTAGDALRASLNLPAIAVLREIGVDAFVDAAQASGIRFRDGTAARAGLGLAVGAAETRLIDLVNAAATFAREGVYVTPRLFEEDPIGSARRVWSAPTAAAIDDVLSVRHRAPALLAHLAPEDRAWMTWKTGTSAGHRDAWSIGHNGRYVVGVWIGRPGGGGVPDLVGAGAAEPVMAALLAHRDIIPRVRHEPDFRLVAAVRAERPMQWPEQGHGLRMESPGAGAVFVALGATSIVPLQASAPVRWFIDAAPLPAGAAHAALPPGVHEVLAVAADGTSVRRSVTVVPYASGSDFAIHEAPGTALRTIRPE